MLLRVQFSRWSCSTKLVADIPDSNHISTIDVLVYIQRSRALERTTVLKTEQGASSSSAQSDKRIVTHIGWICRQLAELPRQGNKASRYIVAVIARECESLPFHENSMINLCSYKCHVVMLCGSLSQNEYSVLEDSSATVCMLTIG